MKPLLAIGAALAAGVAYAFKPKKASAAETEIEPDISPPDVTTVAPGALTPGAGPVSAPAGTTTYQKTGDEWLKTAAEYTKSAGLPPLPTAGTGPTSGATSVTPTGVVDDAFDVLVANAIAKSDLAQLEELAKNAELRGLTDVAKSIREEIARIQGAAPAPTIAKAPTTAPVSTYLGRATISQKAGSKGPDVVEWQRIVGVKQDGIFGPITDSATRTFQRTHKDATGKALVVDGIVGPKTWASAYAAVPTLATAPRTTPVIAPAITAPAPIIAAATNTYPTIKYGSRGEAVKTWQGIIKVKVDGIFGSITLTATKAFQKSKGLVVDGIVGPKTWAAGLASPVTGTGIAGNPVYVPPGAQSILAPPPTSSPVVESPMRQAAREMTDYLRYHGGLSGRGSEDKTAIKGWQTKLALTADGMYGRNSAKAVMLQGFVPVVPFYWPSTGTTTAKAEFTSFVRQYADNDPARKAEWDKLLADIPRS